MNDREAEQVDAFKCEQSPPIHPSVYQPLHGTRACGEEQSLDLPGDSIEVSYSGDLFGNEETIDKRSLKESRLLQSLQNLELTVKLPVRVATTPSIRGITTDLDLLEIGVDYNWCLLI